MWVKNISLSSNKNLGENEKFLPFNIKKMFLSFLLGTIIGNCLSFGNEDDGDNTPYYNKPNFSSPSYNALADGGGVSLYVRKGYTLFWLVGMYYHLPPNCYGRFNGYAVAETDNEYDKYAVGVYEEETQNLIGYVPKGLNKTIHKYILQEGGSVHAYGYVQLDENGQYNSEVCIESNKNEVKNRNKPYKVESWDKLNFNWNNENFQCVNDNDEAQGCAYGLIGIFCFALICLLGVLFL